MAAKSSKKQRLRWGKLPKPDVRADLYWSNQQAELKRLTHAEIVKLYMNRPEFQQTIGKKLDEIDERNRTGHGNNQGRPVRWSAWQLESVFIYRRVAGLSTIKRALERLTCDESGRMLLGLGQLPTAPTLTRYARQHFDKAERAELHMEFDRQLRQLVMQLPGFDDEARILGIDGSRQGTRYTVPIPERKRGKLTGRFINDKKLKGEKRAITAPDGGFVGGNNPKSGKGWQFIGLWTEHGTLVGWDISPLNEHELSGAYRVLEEYEHNVLSYRTKEQASVCSADNGFSSPEMRQQLQDLRIVPNIHKSSHGDSERTRRAVNEKNKDWVPFKHPSNSSYANWQVNGHGELRCQCGAGVIKRDFPISTKTQKLTIATKGQCSKCGNITITAGRWRRVQNPNRYVPCRQGELGDPAVGNSLTYNDHLSLELGRDRFGFGESVHATLEQRFGLLKDRSPMRDMTQVKTEFAIAASTISLLLLERYARRTAPAPLTTIAGSTGNHQIPALPAAA